MLVYTYNSRIQQAKAEGMRASGHPGVHNKVMSQQKQQIVRRNQVKYTSASSLM